MTNLLNHDHKARMQNSTAISKYSSGILFRKLKYKHCNKHYICI